MTYHTLRQDSLICFHPGLLAMPPDLCPWRQSGRTGSEMSRPGSDMDPPQKSDFILGYELFLGKSSCTHFPAAPGRPC